MQTAPNTQKKQHCIRTIRSHNYNHTKTRLLTTYTARFKGLDVHNMCRMRLFPEYLSNFGRVPFWR